MFYLYPLTIFHYCKHKNQVHRFISLKLTTLFFTVYKITVVQFVKVTFFFLWLYSTIQALAASMKLFISLQVLDLWQAVGLLGRVISSSQGHKVHKHRKTHTQHKQYTSMPLVGFEPIVSVSARAKTVDVLDHTATVTGKSNFTARSRFTIRPINDYPRALRRCSIAMRLQTIAGTKYEEDGSGTIGKDDQPVQSDTSFAAAHLQLVT
jgi:hypothetical protein